MKGKKGIMINKAIIDVVGGVSSSGRSRRCYRGITRISFSSSAMLLPVLVLLSLFFAMTSGPAASNSITVAALSSYPPIPTGASEVNAAERNRIIQSLETLASTSGDDVRGIVPGATAGESIQNPLLPGAARWIGAAFRAWLVGDCGADGGGGGGIAVGRDPRVSSPSIAAAFRRGSAGLDAGLATTPAMLEWALRSSGRTYGNCLGSAMVTASHLPMEWNGLKFFSASLRRGLNKKEVSEIMDLAVRLAKESNEDEAATVGNGDHEQGDCGNDRVALENFMDPYIEKLRQTVIRGASDAVHGQTGQDGKPLEGMRICVNAGNGAGGFFAHVLESLGADCLSSSIHLTPDGAFPNHPANPEDQDHVDATVDAMMGKVDASAVVDIGVMLDTDADRCGLVDGTPSASGTRPREVNRNRLIALCSKIAIEEDRGDAAIDGAAGTVVTDPVTSSGLKNYVVNVLGASHDRYRMGYRNVIDRAASLAPNAAVLAIETSGHSAWRDNEFVDDGCYTAAKVLGYLARERRRTNRRRMGLLDLLDGRLDEPEESVKVRMTVPAGLPAIPAAEKVLRDALVKCCDENADWEMEKINHDGLRASVLLPPLPIGEKGAGSDTDGGGGDGWLIVRSSLHEPITSIQLESDIVGGTAHMCSTMLRQILRRADENNDVKDQTAGIDLEPLKRAAMATDEPS